MDPRCGSDAFNRDAPIRQLKRQREAVGMSCADQLLRVRPLALGRARPEALRTVECAAPKPRIPGT